MEYLILDGDHSSLTRGTLRNPITAPTLEFEIPESDIHRLDDLEPAVSLQFIGFDQSSPSFSGKINRRRGNRLAVEKGPSLGEDPRENLRAPFFFSSYLYPVSGDWKGRMAIDIVDLSCGGMGFYAKELLEVHETVELAVPVTAGPLLIQGKIVRPLADEVVDISKPIHYVAKFMSGVDEVEMEIRKEVLKQQLNHRDQKGGAALRKILFQEEI